MPLVLSTCLWVYSIVAPPRRSVPYDLYFHPAGLGYFIHGTYWHDRFAATQSYGTSHGCVNLDLGDAEFVYNWAGVGTPVVITP